LSSNMSVGVRTQQINRQLCSTRSCNASRSDIVEGLLSCRTKLHFWFLEQGVSEGRAAQAIRLCEGKYLQAQPRPASWNQRGKFGIREHCRYLWYRHAVRLLGWYERKQFPASTTEILCSHIYSTAGEDDEETCAYAIEVNVRGPCNHIDANIGQLGRNIDADIGHSRRDAPGEYPDLLYFRLGQWKIDLHILCNSGFRVQEFVRWLFV
jgi:hypothetical protein